VVAKSVGGGGGGGGGEVRSLLRTRFFFVLDFFCVLRAPCGNPVGFRMPGSTVTYFVQQPAQRAIITNFATTHIQFGGLSRSSTGKYFR
jgi:hypothetical protein